MPSGKLKKVTVMLPEDLLKRATKASGLGVTPTIRKGLESIAGLDPYEELLKLRGTYQFSIDIEDMRRD